MTKDYGKRRGIFDMSFEVEDGEVFGYLGPDGAGKSTTIRQLLGYAIPSRGRCFINGKSCHTKAEEIHGFTGYLPEREALPERLSGVSFLRTVAGIRGVRSLEYVTGLAEHFELGLGTLVYRMSKSDRQKLALICAFMHDPGVLLLDEPTKWLDAAGKHQFASLIQEERKKGKTILIASDAFDEIEHICDRVGMIKAGSLVKVGDIGDFRAVKKMEYVVTFHSEAEAERFSKEPYQLTAKNGRQLTVSLTGEMTPLVESLGGYGVVGIEAAHLSLDKIFEYYFGGGAGA